MNKLRKQFTINFYNEQKFNEETDFQKIIKIKDHILKLSKNENKFDDNDLIKYVNDTKKLKKFIKLKNKFEDNVQHIYKILCWRKESGLSNLTLHSFPR